MPRVLGQKDGMTYQISGLDPTPFLPLFDLDEASLTRIGVRRMPVTDRPGAPCRLTLDDAQVGERVLLLNHVSVPFGPYKASHAIFVTEGVGKSMRYEDIVPPAMDRRTLSLRAFAEDFDMVDAMLVQPGEADAGIRRLLDNPEVRSIHAHYATRGCFAAVVERS